MPSDFATQIVFVCTLFAKKSPIPFVALANQATRLEVAPPKRLVDVAMATEPPSSAASRVSRFVRRTSVAVTRAESAFVVDARSGSPASAVSVEEAFNSTFAFKSCID